MSTQVSAREKLNQTILRYVSKRKRQKCVSIPLEVVERFRRVQQIVGMQDWVIITAALETFLDKLEKELGGGER